jgi:hypothetical protein
MLVKVSIVSAVLYSGSGLAASGLFFNVSASGLNLIISTTVPGHTYPAAGIKINTSGYSLTNESPGCTSSPNGYCLFPVSDTVPASINISGPSGTVKLTLCLNGKGPLSCQNYSLTVVGGACGRFTTGFTGSWSTVANNPLSSGMGFSGYLPQGTAATLYLGRSNTFDSFTSNGSGGSYTTLSPPPTSFQQYGSMAYFGGSIWAMTSGKVIKYDIATNTWTTPATGLVTANLAQTTIDDDGNLWTWQDASNLLKYNIASGTTTTFPLHASLGGIEPRIVYDSCSRLLFLADYTRTGFYSYDPSTGTVTTLSSLPGSLPFQDGFCSDQSGHIFAATNGSGMYQYSISTGAWVALPAGGLIGNSNSSCGVGSDGYLYASDPAISPTVYRIQLQ